MAVAVFLFGLMPETVLAAKAVLSKIDIQKKPLAVKFFIDQEVPAKVIQIEKKELLVALKNVMLSKDFKIQGRKTSGIAKIGIDNLPGNVVAVILTKHRPYSYIQSGFDRSESVFTIHFEKTSHKKQAAVSTPPADNAPEKPEKTKIQKVSDPDKSTAPSTTIKRKEPAVQEKTAPVVSSTPVKKPVVVSRETAKVDPEAKPVLRAEKKETPKKTPDQKPAVEPVKPTEKTAVSSPVYIPVDRKRGKYKGDISDMVGIMDAQGCDADVVKNAMVFLKRRMYTEAYEILDPYVSQQRFECLEQAYFLRAFAFFKSIENDDGFSQLLKTGQLFQEALVAFPKSIYLPYGYAALGLLEKQLNNTAVAQGYFNIVKEGYLEYSGMPELMYHLAAVYDKQGYLDKALRYYKQVFEDPVENSYIADAGIGYGKTLYKKHRYLDTLSVLNYVVKLDYKKVYDTPELLFHIGTANFEVGNSEAARDHLNRVLNLFPGVENPDVILSKIGDTYGMENNSQKAVKIYELVREMYPDTDGYISSSIGIARYLETDEEKIKIYEMVKTKFPENKFARISMMRLAEIYQAQGEYNKCIQEIEDLLSTHPRGLRYEAVKLMQKAYEALFKQQLKSDGYTQVLNRYELEHVRIDRMGSREIALHVGLSYLEAKLYEESFNHLINAYKQYKRSSRPAELLFGLGTAMDESGRDDDALKLFSSFSKRFPKHPKVVEALYRAGAVYLEQNKYKTAVSRYKKAFQAAGTHMQKGDVLLRHSKVYEKKKEMKKAAALKEKAIKEFALASGENYPTLSNAYKELGKTYIALKHYIKSADAYAKALQFSQDNAQKANIGFLLGDAYQKGNAISKAQAVFENVVENFDSIWSRMAEQRLTTLELARIAQNS